MPETPTAVTTLKCEHCTSETTATPDPEWASNDTDGETTYSIDCTNDNCPYDGWVVVTGEEIIEFGGDMFPMPEHSSYHHGWREEPSVLYKEHYRLIDEDEFEEEDHMTALNFTNDEVLNGYNPTVTYECSCYLSFDSKNELSDNLRLVRENRGENAVK